MRSAVSVEDRSLAASEGVHQRSLLKEIHHQVKNNLQIVCSLLRLQARYLHDADAQAAFRRSEERIQSMALVYDKLYRGNSVFEVPLDEYISELISQIMRARASTENKTTVVSELSPLLIGSKAATTCGLILSEAMHIRLSVMNEEHENGILKVVLISEDDRVRLELHDNGPEWDPSAALHKLSIQIIQALVAQLEGTLEFSNNGGTSLLMNFPLATLLVP